MLNNFPSKSLLLSLLLYTSASGLTCALAAGNLPEQTNLELMLRQLEAIKRLAQQNEKFPEAAGERYHFDYQRLEEDLERIHQGIQSHLSPIRAQPRDPGDLTGHYSVSEVGKL